MGTRENHGLKDVVIDGDEVVSREGYGLGSRSELV
jgi:hypothetical protein